MCPEDPLEKNAGWIPADAGRARMSRLCGPLSPDPSGPISNGPIHPDRFHNGPLFTLRPILRLL